jgi:hypothetical protein
MSGFEGSQAVSACPSGIGRAYDRIFYVLIYFFIFMTLEGVNCSKILGNVGKKNLLGFPQSLRVIAGVIPRLSHYGFLPTAFQLSIMIHQLFHNQIFK